MKYLKLCFATLALIALVACQSPPDRIAYNTLTTVGKATTDSYQAYLQGVLQGNIPTNNVPQVTAKYREFKALYDAAMTAASKSTNFTTVSPALQSAAGAVTTAISAK